MINKTLPWAGLFLIVLFSSCRGSDRVNYSAMYGIESPSRSLNILLDELFTTGEADRRFALCDRIISELQSQGESMKLLLVLQDYLKTFPEDPYRAYYYTIMAKYYIGIDSKPLAIDYYRRILYSTQDLILENQSIHLLILKEWLTINESLDDRITIYEMLISSFSDQINLGECYFYLAKAYERRGDFDRSLSYYERYLANPNHEIPGMVSAYEDVQAMVNFHYSDKSWTFDSQDDLVNAVKYAIGSRKIHLLNNYQSDNFFILSWSQKMMNLDEGVSIGDLTSYKFTRIFYSPTLESFSNKKEAYLKTWGWSYRVKLWYLYFREVNYPYDPEINGNWEWVGIYMGQPL